MLKKQIDLSIIIINLSTDKYQTRKLLEQAVKSVLPAMDKISSELIVVDNSTIDDGTQKYLKLLNKNINYLKRTNIFGFGDNNNFGLKHAKGRYVLFLNNDTNLIDKNMLKEMVEWMDSHPKVGVSSSSLLNSDRKSLQASGGSFPTLFKVLAWMSFLDDLPFMDKLFNSYHPKNKYFEVIHNQDWVTGAFYLARKEVLNHVGGFDTDYDAYVEETDLSYRIKKMGWEIWYLPKWKIVHLGGQSYGSENSLIFELRNLKLFYKKHMPAWQLPFLRLVIKLGCIVRIVVFSLFKPKLVKIYAKAFKII